MTADLSGYGAPLPIIVNRLQPVGNQVAAESQTASSAALRQAQQSVQATDWSWVQETDGDGVFTFTLTFDVAFTREPVFAHGMAFTEFAAAVRSDLDQARANLTQAQEALKTQSGTAGKITVLSTSTGTGTDYDPVSGAQVATTTWKATVSGTAGGRYRAVVTADGATFKTVPVADGTITLAYPTSASTRSWTLQEFNTTTNTWTTKTGTGVGTFAAPTAGSTEYFAAAADVERKQAALQATLEAGADTDKIPLCSAYVKRWLVDSQNNYTGADMLIVVRTFTTVPAEPEPSGSSD